jgi:hypothetical protein
LLEEDSLVGCVLVEQHQAAVGFKHDVEPRDDADEAQRDFEERDRLCTGRVTGGG